MWPGGTSQVGNMTRGKGMLCWTIPGGIGYAFAPTWGFVEGCRAELLLALLTPPLLAPHPESVQARGDTLPASCRHCFLPAGYPPT